VVARRKNQKKKREGGRGSRGKNGGAIQRRGFHGRGGYSTGRQKDRGKDKSAWVLLQGRGIARPKTSEPLEKRKKPEQSYGGGKPNGVIAIR